MDNLLGKNINEINELLIESLNDLPPLPETIQNLQEYISTRGSNIVIDEIADIISTDPLITANLLHLTNSAYYGFSKEIKTVNQALVLLGVNNVRNMIIADYAKSSFVINLSPYGIETDRFLSLIHEQTNFISSWLMEEDKTLCYSLIPCIMMLRLGIMVFSNFLIQNNVDKRFLLHLSKNNFNNILRLEREFLGVDHISFLSNLFKIWNLDESLIEIISSLDYLSSTNSKIRKETYALAAIEALFSPEKNAYDDFCVQKAYHILKDAKTHGIDFNLENFLNKLPEEFIDILKKNNGNL
ncbi:TPA: HDOD domain-containing protein [Campylobacter coli]|uniref:HDOD domain-containing protein n=1 Tax=Campylobacter coli TaxID=195 RepID=UPI00073EBE5E|nr:HDOD domain-containing protein [Campylobacter coli]HEB7570154.1 HDOD domain-containing protein [Campylobacter coli]HEB9306465.1 HDOD domain-containing protein [Campylobacter coli]HEB9318339.1 HDOD domain-containing protein [Campylobacter coli]